MNLPSLPTISSLKNTSITQYDRYRYILYRPDIWDLTPIHIELEIVMRDLSLNTKGKSITNESFDETNIDSFGNVHSMSKKYRSISM